MSRIPRGLRRAGTAETIAAVAAVLALLVGFVAVNSAAATHARLRLTDGSVWLRSAVHGGITLHDSGDGAPITRLQVALPSEDFEVEQAGSDALVLNRTTGSVSLVDGATWTILRKVSLGTPGDELRVAVGPTDGWLLRPGSVSELRLTDLAVGQAVPLADEIHDAAVGATGRLVAAGTAADSPLLAFSPGAGEPDALDGPVGPAEVFRLEGGAAAVDRATRSVWVEGRGTVCDGLDLAGATDLQASGSGDVAVVVADTGGAFVWSVAEEGCPSSDGYAALGAGEYGEPVLTEGWGVVPDYTRSSVHLVDVPDRRIGAEPISLPLAAGSRFELVAENGTIWFNDPATSTAGIVGPDGSVTLVEKYTTDEAGEFTVPATDAPDGASATPGVGDGLTDGDGSADPVGEAGSTTTEPPSTSEPETRSSSTTESATVTLPAPTDPSTPEPSVLGTTAEPTDPGSTTQPTDPGSTTEPTDPGSTVIDPGGPDPTGEPPIPTTPEPPDPNPGPEPESDLSVRIQAGPSSPEVGETVRFNAAVTGGPAATFSWRLDPDPGVPTDRQSFETSFPEAGRVTVSVVACAEDGETCDDHAVTLDVRAEETAPPLTANIEAPAAVTVGEAATFVDRSDGDPVSRRWAFPGASPATSDDTAPTVVWDRAGNYVVELTVFADDGRSDVARASIRVTEPTTETPELQVSCAPATIDEGATTTCSVAADVAADVEGLTFSTSGPGTVVSQSAPQGRAEIRGTGAGSVTVTARASFDGETLNDTTTVTVREAAESPPDVRITGPADLDVDENGTFRVSNLGGPIDSYRWTATGSASPASGTGDTLTTRWGVQGDYRLTLEVTGPGGTDTATYDVGVKDDTPPLPPPEASRQYFMQSNHQEWPRRNVMMFDGAGAVSVRYVSGETYGGLRNDGTFAHSRQQDGPYEFSFVFDELDGAGVVVGRTTIVFRAEGEAACDPGEAALAVSNLAISEVSDTRARIDWTTNTLAGTVNVSVTGGGQTLSSSSPNEHGLSHQFIPGEARYTGSNQLAPGTAYSVSVTMRTPCGAEASRTGSFTTTGTPGSTEPQGPPAAPSGFRCEYRNIVDENGTVSWQERWDWVDNSDNDTRYEFYDRNGAVIAGSEFHAATFVLTNRTSVGLGQIVNVGPGGSTPVSITCPGAGGGSYPVATSTSSTTSSSTTTSSTTTTTESTTSSSSTSSSSTTSEATTTSSETTTTTEATTTSSSTTEATTSSSEETTSSSTG